MRGVRRHYQGVSIDKLFDPTRIWQPSNVRPDADEAALSKVGQVGTTDHASATGTVGAGDLIRYDLGDGAGQRWATVMGDEYQTADQGDLLVAIDDYTHALIPRSAVVYGETSELARQAAQSTREAITELLSPEPVFRADIDFDGIFPTDNPNLVKAASLEGAQDVIFVTATYDPALGVPTVEDLEPFIAHEAQIEEITPIGEGVLKVAVASRFRVMDLASGLATALKSSAPDAVEVVRGLLTSFADAAPAQLTQAADQLAPIVARALAFAGVPQNLMTKAQNLAVKFNPKLTPTKGDAQTAQNPARAGVPNVTTPEPATASPATTTVLGGPQIPRTDDLTVAPPPGTPVPRTDDLTLGASAEASPGAPGGPVSAFSGMVRALGTPATAEAPGRTAQRQKSPKVRTHESDEKRTSDAELLDKLRCKVVAVANSRVYVRVRWSNVKGRTGLDATNLITRGAGQVADGMARSFFGVPQRDRGVILRGVGPSSRDPLPTDGECMIVFTFQAALGNMGEVPDIGRDADQVRVAQADLRSMDITDLGLVFGAPDDDAEGGEGDGDAEGVDADAAVDVEAGGGRTTQREIVRRLSPADMARGQQGRVDQQVDENKARERRKQRNQEHTQPGATQRPSWLTAAVRKL